jgi:methionine-rich copper-binding protein CopC
MMQNQPPTLGRARRALAAAVFALGVGLIASPLSASAFHLGLKKSEPTKGASLTSLPPEVKLWFTARPQIRYTRLVLVGPVGEVTLGKPVQDAAADAPVVFPVQGGGQVGTYTAKWVTAGQDGHPIKGEFSFEVK